MWTATFILQMILGQAWAVTATPQSVEIYHMPGQTVRIGRLTRKLKSNGMHIRYYAVNHQVRLPAILPLDMDALRRQAENDPRLQQEAQALLGRMRASSLGLTHMPAVVIDGKWVIYGTLDIDACIRKWRARQ